MSTSNPGPTSVSLFGTAEQLTVSVPQLNRIRCGYLGTLEWLEKRGVRTGLNTRVPLYDSGVRSQPCPRTGLKRISFDTVFRPLVLPLIPFNEDIFASYGLALHFLGSQEDLVSCSSNRFPVLIDPRICLCCPMPSRATGLQFSYYRSATLHSVTLHGGAFLC